MRRRRPNTSCGSSLYTGIRIAVRSRKAGSGPADGPLPALRERTAILMPGYNEDPQEVFGRLRLIYRSLEGTGQLAAFDFFVLSDTTRPDVAELEQAIF